MSKQAFLSSQFPRPSATALVLAFVLRLLQPRAQAEGHVDYKFEDYNEDNGRIHITTHSYLLELPLKIGRAHV